MAVAAQHHGEPVERIDDALQFYAVHKEDRNGHLARAQVREEDVLNVLRLFAHGAPTFDAAVGAPAAAADGTEFL